MDENFPLNERGTISELNISGLNLEGDLDLSDFRSLEGLFCYSNALTSITFPPTITFYKLRCDCELILAKENALIGLEKTSILLILPHYVSHYSDSFSYNSTSKFSFQKFRQGFQKEEITEL